MNICSFYLNYDFILFKVDFCDKLAFMILEQFLPDKALSHNKKALDELLVVDNNSWPWPWTFFFTGRFSIEGERCTDPSCASGPAVPVCPNE